MSRPVTLFTGQWADLSLAELLPLVKKMGYDGVELACWGDHFEPDQHQLSGQPGELNSTRQPRHARCQENKRRRG
jgi:sugar phosphate isomerase/epimerase